MNVGVGESVILECFLPSFPVCGPLVYVTPTSPSAQTDEGGENQDQTIQELPFLSPLPCLLPSSLCVHPRLFSLTSSFNPSPLFLPFLCLLLVLVSEERMKPLPSTGNWMAWKETTITASRFSLNPFPPSSFSVIPSALSHGYIFTFPMNWVIPHD